MRFQIFGEMNPTSAATCLCKVDGVLSVGIVNRLLGVNFNLV